MGALGEEDNNLLVVGGLILQEGDERTHQVERTIPHTRGKGGTDEPVLNHVPPI